MVSLFQSINSPHLAIPGKQAGPAQGYIVGVRGGAGFAVFIYLHLAESADCAVYVSQKRALAAADYPNEESDAVAFVESMGFIMDNLNFRTLAQADQETLVKSLPVFMKDPSLAGRPAKARSEGPKASPSGQAAALGRLFSSF